MISSRPAEVDERREVGHWEVDTVIGRGSKMCLVTLVERVTGYGFIGLMANRTARETTVTIVEMTRKSGLPFKTITADNGSEFHSYKYIERQTGITFYFANPYHSWERGSNENFNGLVRGYIPKGASMSGFTQAYCDRISDHLNQRPRRRLKYMTPREVAHCLPASGALGG
jgi:IS30 family transposase